MKRRKSRKEYKPRTLDEILAELPDERRKRIANRSRELLAQEMSLQDLRKAAGKTQVAMARRLKIGQDAISRIESRSDMYLSTLRGFVEAMGGELKLVAHFPDRPSVTLEEIGSVAPRRKRTKTAA